MGAHPGTGHVHVAADSVSIRETLQSISRCSGCTAAGIPKLAWSGWELVFLMFHRVNVRHYQERHDAELAFRMISLRVPRVDEIDENDDCVVH